MDQLEPRQLQDARLRVVVIEDKEVGTFFGDCGLIQQVEGEEVLEVGYHLQDRHRGQGYATAAGRACVAHASGVLDTVSVCSIVDPDSSPSIQVASRIHQHHRDFIDSIVIMMLLYLAAHASGLTPAWQRQLGLVGGSLLLAAGLGNVAIADGSALIFVGLLGIAAWLVWLLATGVPLVRSDVD